MAFSLTVHRYYTSWQYYGSINLYILKINNIFFINLFMADEKKDEVKAKEKELLPPSLIEKLEKETKRLKWMAIGLVVLVVINLSIGIATIVLVVSRPTTGQFLNNTPNLQRFRN